MQPSQLDAARRKDLSYSYQRKLTKASFALLLPLSIMSTDNGNDINEWIDSFSQQQMQIWCEDPETNTEKIGMGMGKTYVTYRILMKQVGRDIIGVRHRYSEFETLRNSLRDRYGPLGIAVPALPPKNSVSNIMSSNLQQTFIKERILGLTIFCELIVASPWLRNDKLWKEFMKPKAGGGYSAPDAPPAPSAASRFSAAFTRGVDINPSPPSVVYDVDNVGENKLIGCLQQLEVPYKFTLMQRMEEVRIEMASIDKFVRLALDKVRNLQASERTYATAQENAAEALAQWLAVEQAGVRTMAGKTFDETPSVVQHPFEHTTQAAASLTTLLKAKSALFAHYPDYTGLTLAVLLEQELVMVESLKELLRLHDEMISGIESMTAKIVKTEASRSANKFEQAAEQRIILEERQASLTAFYKGFVYFSLPCAARHRAASVRRFSSFLSASQLTSSYALQVACLQFFTELSVKPTNAIAEASRLFELLKVKQLQVLPEEVALGMCSPSVSPSTSAMNLSDSGSRSPHHQQKQLQLVKGCVGLCEESTGINGLFRRAQNIGQSKGQTPEPRRNVIGASSVGAFAEPASAPVVAKTPAPTVSYGQNNHSAGSGPVRGGSSSNMDAGSSLMAEVPDEMLSEYDIRPSEAPSAPSAPSGSAVHAGGSTRSDPFASGRLSPLKPSEKSQSLMADLIGGGSSGSGKSNGDKPAAAASSVWEDV